MHLLHTFRHTGILLLTGMLLTAMPACKKENSAGTTSAGQDDLPGFVFEDIPGSDTKYARKPDATGMTSIEGFVRNGKRTGMWIEYGTSGDIGLINHFVDGELEGVSMHMTYRNQVDLKSTYHKGKLHGPWVMYKFGKIVEERNYKDGQLDGLVNIYDDHTFKVKQATQYKNGVQDGYLRYYDEEGNITVEYIFKNGEKVSGGMTSN